MRTFTFTLILDPAVDFEEVNRNDAIARHCDDALVGERYGVTYMTFDRDGETLESALQHAKLDIKEAGFQVTRIEPGDLVTKAEIARRSGRSRESIDQLSLGERGDGSFPKPEIGLVDGPTLWSWAAVSEWLSDHDRKRESKQRAKDAFSIREMNGHLREELGCQLGPVVPKLS